MREVAFEPTIVAHLLFGGALAHGLVSVLAAILAAFIIFFAFVVFAASGMLLYALDASKAAPLFFLVIPCTFSGRANLHYAILAWIFFLL